MSDKLRAAAKAALEWLKDKRLDAWPYMEGIHFYADRHNKFKALEAALAEPEQEPVAWKHPNKNMVFWEDTQVKTLEAALADPEQEPVAWKHPNKEDTKEVDEYRGFKPTIPLYTAPPRREWVGLTDDEIWQEWSSPKDSAIDFARAIEAKLREKNT